MSSLQVMLHLSPDQPWAWVLMPKPPRTRQVFHGRTLLGPTTLPQTQTLGAQTDLLYLQPHWGEEDSSRGPWSDLRPWAHLSHLQMHWPPDS